MSRERVESFFSKKMEKCLVRNNSQIIYFVTTAIFTPKVKNSLLHLQCSFLWLLSTTTIFQSLFFFFLFGCGGGVVVVTFQTKIVLYVYYSFDIDCPNFFKNLKHENLAFKFTFSNSTSFALKNISQCTLKAVTVLKFINSIFQK